MPPKKPVQFDPSELEPVQINPQDLEPVGPEGGTRSEPFGSRTLQSGKSEMVRGSTLLEKARGAMFELPQEIAGTVAPMAASAMSGLSGLAARTGLSAIGGAAGRAFSESAKSLPMGVRGAMVGSVLGPLGGTAGMILDAVTSLTAQDERYEPKPREGGPDLLEAAGQEAFSEAAGGALGMGIGKLRSAISPSAQTPPTPIFGQAGKEAGTYTTEHPTALSMARERGLPILPSDVAEGGMGRTLESLARYGSKGRELFEATVRQREATLKDTLHQNLDQISDVMSKEEAGQAFIQNMDSYRKAAFDAPAAQLYDQAEKLMAMQTQQRQLPGEPIFNDLYEQTGVGPAKTVTEQVGPFVDMRPIKKMLEDEFNSMPEFRQHAIAAENKNLKAFLGAYETIPDQMSFSDARQLRSDILSLLRQSSTPDKAKRVEGEAVGLYNEALEKAAQDAGVPEAFDMVQSANRLWKARQDTFFNEAIEGLVKKGERGPELVGKMIWQPGSITQTRKTLQALGGKLTDKGLQFPSPELQKAWNITRRAGFQNIADSMAKAKSQPEVWTKWWDKLDPDQRLLMANGDSALKKDYDELFHAMNEFSAKMHGEKAKGLGLQSPEKTSMIYAAIAAAGFGTGYAGSGDAQGGAIGAGGFLTLAFGGPWVLGKLLLSKPGTRVLIDGIRAFDTPAGFTAENVVKYGTRAAWLAANTNEESGKFEPKPISSPPSLEPVTVE